MKKYQPQQFEKKWIDQWDEEKTYKTQSTSSRVQGSEFRIRGTQNSERKTQNKKMYVLDMFPYPSGTGLHVGHPRGYTATDILSRYYRMNGYSVLHPMGWDAFGLPAENAAIKAKKNPIDIVPENIATFKRQMKMLGLSYDWEKEFSTTDPAYYKWTQWLFIQFFKMGLLVKKNTPVYYCPTCKTGLAEEEVLPNGLHERCGNPITRKELPQWIFRITTYADRLLQDLNGLDWPVGILEMQRNWIGRKEGINITYKVVLSIPDARSQMSDDRSQTTDEKQESDIRHQTSEIDTITCFTTRPDTNFGATFIVLAPEHDFVKKIISDKNTPEEYRKAVQQYVDKALAKTDLERIAEGKKKTGTFSGYYAANNLNNKLMQIWVSDFVLSGFGTGAVVGVPGHDMRDFEFAQEFGIDIVRVVVGKDGDTSAITCKGQVQEEEGMMVNSGFLNGLDIHEATKKIMDYFEEKGWGKRVVSYHLRDWIFSRQRYWGEPTPMAYCENCASKSVSWWDTEDARLSIFDPRKSDQNISKVDKEVQDSTAGWFPIDEKTLPLELPYLKSYEPPETGESPLIEAKDWVKTTCPNCGGEARRETDTMPNWAGSCWYFLAFPVWDEYEKNKNMDIFQIPDARLQMSDDRSHLPVGEAGMTEKKSSDIRHLTSDIHTWLPVDWYFGGAEHAVLHLLYSRFWIKALYDLGIVDFKEPFLRLRNVGMILAADHRKMSKSWGNVINPDEVVAEYGADALRVYEMFMAPFSQEIAWSTETLQGSYRFLRRVWKLVQHEVSQIPDARLQMSDDRSHLPVGEAGMTEKKSSDIRHLTSDIKLVQKLNKTIKKVSEDIVGVKFNTAVAAMMEFLNEWERAVGPATQQPHARREYPAHEAPRFVQPTLSTKDIKRFLKILAPFAPFTTEELWREVLGEKESIHLSDWPSVDEKSLVEEEISIPVQVNGKVRAVVTVPADKIEQNDVVEKALKDQKIAAFLKGKKYSLVYVKGKILNFVVKV